MNRKKCMVDGCGNIAAKESSKCYKHIRGNSLNAKQRKQRKIFNRSCALCGWEGPCDRHRMVMGKDGGKYTPLNTISVCPNCHRLIHLGLIHLANPQVPQS